MKDEQCCECGKILEKDFDYTKNNDMPFIPQYIGVEVTGAGWYCDSCWLAEGHSAIFSYRKARS